jgi:hypothetical protein
VTSSLQCRELLRPEGRPADAARPSTFS